MRGEVIYREVWGDEGASNKVISLVVTSAVVHGKKRFDLGTCLGLEFVCIINKKPFQEHLEEGSSPEWSCGYSTGIEVGMGRFHILFSKETLNRAWEMAQKLKGFLLMQRTQIECLALALVSSQLSVIPGNLMPFSVLFGLAYIRWGNHVSCGQ